MDPELLAAFDQLEDPRNSHNVRHPLPVLLFIALATILCGGETCADMELFARSKRDFLATFLPLRHGTPSHDTFSRVFRLLNPAAFERWFLSFMQQFAAQLPPGAVAVDGKTLRRSYDRAAGQAPLHLVNAWAHEQRLCLGQVAVAGKSNEITALPQLLALLSLEGTIVTADAMHCQRELARELTTAGADYVLALKGNQPNLHEAVTLFLEDPATPVAAATTLNKGHGRVETRTASVSSSVGWLHEQLEQPWPGLAAVGKVTARRQIGDTASAETRYYLLSQAWSPEEFNALARGHWDIENGLHWSLDVVFKEDQARNRKGHCARNLALLRKLALNLARLEPGKGSMRGKLKRAGWDNAFLVSLLSQCAPIYMQ